MKNSKAKTGKAMKDIYGVFKMDRKDYRDYGFLMILPVNSKLNSEAEAEELARKLNEQEYGKHQFGLIDDSTDYEYFVVKADRGNFDLRKYCKEHHLLNDDWYDEEDEYEEDEEY